MITTRALRDTNATALSDVLFHRNVRVRCRDLAVHRLDHSDGTRSRVFAALGISNVVARCCVIRALKLASASVVVPYQYTLIVWSVVFGWLMFGVLPDRFTERARRS